ncbi:MAG: NADH-quinone oxidoreductase subunit J [Chloroflexota bacterium]|nr:NADH-quinone oxidoreductase subunit J [Chloroflexota bacterium]
MDLIVFYLFAFTAFLGAVGVITLRNPVHSALSLAVVFVSLAAMYVLLSAPFIAVAQVMIYAGAILILFVFVIMLLSPGVDQGAGALKSQRGLAATFGSALLIELVIVLAAAILPSARGEFTPERIAQVGDVQAVGGLLFTSFLLPFEITSMLLLVAIVGVIVLAKRKVRD